MPSTPSRLARWGPAIAVLLLHLACLPGYGVFRDELYYMACGRHPALGYVDHPPLVAWLAWLIPKLVEPAHIGLRGVAALAAAGAVWLAGDIATTLGGRSFARALAGLATGFAPVVLSLASVYSMNSIDLLIWAALSAIVARLLTGADPRLWLGFGALAGLGLLNKISVLYLGFAVLVGLVLARRDLLRARWPYLGAAIAAAMFAPHLLWQRAHAWPTLEFMANARAEKMVPLSPTQFLGAAVEQTGPVAWLWIWGAVWLLLAPAAARVRPLGITFVVVLAVLVVGGGKTYYLAAAYTMVFAAGAVALERATAGRARVLRWPIFGLVFALGLAVAPLARPMLPVEQYVRYAALLGQQPGTDERQEIGRLPQFYADMHGWRAFAGAVAEVADRLPPDERVRVCVFAQNYGEAGALEYYAPELGLPPVISGHNNYWLWGPGECTSDILLILSKSRERLDPLFHSVEPGGVTECKDCMPYEDGVTIWIARGGKQSLAAVWPQLRRFI